MAPPTLSLTAFVVCDTIIEEKFTNKKSLIGVFTNIYAHAFPCRHHNIGIYFCLTNAEGNYEIKLRLLQSDSDKTLGEATGVAKIADIQSINDFAINLRDMVFQSAGRYEFQLFVNGSFLDRKEFRVIHLEGAKK